MFCLFFASLRSPAAALFGLRQCPCDGIRAKIQDRKERVKKEEEREKCDADGGGFAILSSHFISMRRQFLYALRCDYFFFLHSDTHRFSSRAHTEGGAVPILGRPLSETNSVEHTLLRSALTTGPTAMAIIII